MILLAPHTEPITLPEDMPSELNRVREGLGLDSLLYHQVETYRALKDNAIVFNTSATGTGKTISAQLHLLRGAEVTVVIAPTNALIDQHESDWRAFCKEAGLTQHLVIALDAQRLAKLNIREFGPRANSARRLYEVISNPHKVLGLKTRPKLVLVTNPDLFYLATFFRYRRTAQHAADAFLNRVDYLVIDEFHYYSGIQLVAFFFVLGLWHLTGGGKSHRRVCLLTATPDGEVEKLFEGLERMGVLIQKISPEDAPPNAPRQRSLAPCLLHFGTLERSKITEMRDQICALLLKRREDILAKKMDTAVLLDTLSSVSALHLALRGAFSENVRRITGPTPSEQRAEAQRAPLILATPTVDIGYNFRGSSKNKQRQSIDLVIFAGPSLSSFWQRLGRAGRVLGAKEKNHPSTAFAFVPTRLKNALYSSHPEWMAEDKEISVTREELNRVLLSHAESFEDPRVAPLLSGWAARAISEPLSKIYNIAADENKPIIENLFKQLMSIFSSTDEVPDESTLFSGRRDFKGFLRLHRSIDEARSFASGEIPFKPKFSWLPLKVQGQKFAQQLGMTPGASPLDQHRFITQSVRSFYKSWAKPLQEIAASTVACHNMAMQFRGSGSLGTDVLAWDEPCLYADRPDWVRLSLEECVRATDFEIIDEALRAHLPPPPRSWGDPLQVRLIAPAEPRRTLSLLLDDPDRSPPDFRGYLAVDTRFEIRARIQAQSKAIDRLPEEIVLALKGRPLVFFIPYSVADLKALPAANGLRDIDIILNDKAPLRGFLGQHAILADALARGLRRKRR